MAAAQTFRFTFAAARGLRAVCLFTTKPRLQAGGYTRSPLPSLLLEAMGNNLEGSGSSCAIPSCIGGPDMVKMAVQGEDGKKKTQLARVQLNRLHLRHIHEHEVLVGVPSWLLAGGGHNNSNRDDLTPVTMPGGLIFRVSHRAGLFHVVCDSSAGGGVTLKAPADADLGREVELKAELRAFGGGSDHLAAKESYLRMRMGSTVTYRDMEKKHAATRDHGAAVAAQGTKTFTPAAYAAVPGGKGKPQILEVALRLASSSSSNDSADLTAHRATIRGLLTFPLTVIAGEGPGG